jgi:3-carboxy-cis,cis-muconate cycloisomerase
MPRLRARTRVVGYPILPLLEQLADACPPMVRQYLHWGTTTQDIMDSGRSLQILAALDRIEELLISVGDTFSRLGSEHARTVMVGRTHAQHAVPVTLGAKLAVWLDELARHLARVRAVRPRVALVQLFGAAGTAAALGPDSKEIRRRVAEQLGLARTDVPWHVARDGVAELGFVLAAISTTCSKIAREVIELSRPEINELREESGHLRGASSTMPQKVNPIRSETIVGLGFGAQACVSVLLSAMVGGHERSAGEWQAEWDAVPAVFGYGAASLAGTLDLIGGLQVDVASMSSNIDADHGLLMAEALMMRLAPTLGRHEAHEIVYDVCARVRGGNATFLEAARATFAETGIDISLTDGVLDPSAYLGEAVEIVECAVGAWAAAKARAHQP